MGLEDSVWLPCTVSKLGFDPKKPHLVWPPSLSAFTLEEFLKCVEFCVINLADSIELHFIILHLFTYLFIYCFTLLTCCKSVWRQLIIYTCLPVYNSISTYTHYNFSSRQKCSPVWLPVFSKWHFLFQTLNYFETDHSFLMTWALSFLLSCRKLRVTPSVQDEAWALTSGSTKASRPQHPGLIVLQLTPVYQIIEGQAACLRMCSLRLCNPIQAESW